MPISHFYRSFEDGERKEASNKKKSKQNMNYNDQTMKLALQASLNVD